MTQKGGRLTFTQEAREAQPVMPYNGKKRWLAKRVPGFAEALADDDIEATTIATLLQGKGYPVPYRTVRRWCNEERGLRCYG